MAGSSGNDGAGFVGVVDDCSSASFCGDSGRGDAEGECGGGDGGGVEGGVDGA